MSKRRFVYKIKGKIRADKFAEDVTVSVTTKYNNELLRKALDDMVVILIESELLRKALDKQISS